MNPTALALFTLAAAPSVRLGGVLGWHLLLCPCKVTQQGLAPVLSTIPPLSSYSSFLCCLPPSPLPVRHSSVSSSHGFACRVQSDQTPNPAEPPKLLQLLLPTVAQPWGEQLPAPSCSTEAWDGFQSLWDFDVVSGCFRSRRPVFLVDTSKSESGAAASPSAVTDWLQPLPCREKVGDCGLGQL